MVSMGAWINVIANRYEHRPVGFLPMLLLLIVLGLIAGCSVPGGEAQIRKYRE